MKPTDASYPYQIELFSRSLGLLNFPKDAHITPIPTDEDLSSLSAILMDDDYHSFTIRHSLQEKGVHIANIESLICLKSKAYIDLTTRRKGGEHVDSKNIQKHKKAVFRLAAMLTTSTKVEVPKSIKEDIKQFIDIASKDKPIADFFHSAGLIGLDADAILNQIKKTFLNDQDALNS